MFFLFAYSFKYISLQEFIALLPQTNNFENNLNLFNSGMGFRLDSLHQTRFHVPSLQTKLNECLLFIRWGITTNSSALTLLCLLDFIKQFLIDHFSSKHLFRNFSYTAAASSITDDCKLRSLSMNPFLMTADSIFGLPPLCSLSQALCQAPFD